MLNPTFLKLKQDRSRLEIVVQQLQNRLQSPVDPNTDEGDPEIGERGVMYALLSNAQAKIESIDHALRQSQQGKYGICEDCQTAINPERLEIFPQTTLCVSCKSQRERTRR